MALDNAAFCSRPMRDIPPCGDGWYCIKRVSTIRVMVADGLGHGINAHRVVLHLIKQISWLSARSTTLPSIDSCLFSLDQYLKSMNESSAQAAVSITDIDTTNHSMRTASVGNIETVFVSNGDGFRFPSLNGMVGGRMPSKLHVSHHVIHRPSLIAMFSDGLHSRMAQEYLQKLSKSTSFKSHDAQAISNQVVKCARSLNDDASCAVITLQEP